MRSKPYVLIVVGAAALSAAARAATPVIYTNTSNLLPNTPNQVLLVYVSGSDQIQGENLNFQVNTGASGPVFTGVDIITGTIFGPSNTGQTVPNDPNYNAQGILINGTAAGHLVVVSTITDDPMPFVTDNGLLATLLVSTTATTGSVFTLNMLSTLNGSSNFGTGGNATVGFSYPHMQISVGASPTRQWQATGGGQWNADANWTPFAPYAKGDIANFLGSVASGTPAITLDAVRTVGTINFNNGSASYDLTPGSGGAGSLILDNGTQSPQISVLAGHHAIDAPIALAATTAISLAGGTTLTISRAITGASADLMLSGGGKLLLTGTGSSYGATNIAAGTALQVGNGTQSASLGTGAISNAGTVTFSNLAGSLAAPLSGAGTAVIDGFFQLTSTSTAASMIITSTGNLQVGNGGTSGLLQSGSITNDGMIGFNRSDAAVQSATITGSGTLTQIAGGTTTLGSAVVYSGPTIISAGRLDFGGSVAHSVAGISGAGSLAIDAATTLTSDGVSVPSVVVNGALVVRSNPDSGAYPDTAPTGSPAVPGTSKVNNLSFAAANSAGQIDIRNNGLILQAADPGAKASLLQTISGESATLFNLTQAPGAFYNVVSSTAASNAAYSLVLVDNADLNADLLTTGGSTSFGGLPVDGNSVLVTQALQGDTNIDGVVDFTDLNVWFRHFGNSNSFSVAGGDLNNDGVVDFTDLNIWFRHFGNAVGTVGNPSAAAGGTLGGGGLGSSAVPEPGSLLLLGIGAAGLLSRRRRRRC